MPKSSRKQIGEDDKKFLKVLQKNSGDSIENIAKNCGFSKQKVGRIKKRLEKTRQSGDITQWLTMKNSIVNDI